MMKSAFTLFCALLAVVITGQVAPAQPVLGFSPEGFDADSDEYPGRFWTAFNIGNSGSETLTWELRLELISSPGDHNLNWLIPTRMEGQTGPGENSIVPIEIVTENMREGVYIAEVQIHSNDPRDQLFNFPIDVIFSEIGSKAMQLLPTEVRFEGHYGQLETEEFYFASVMIANLGESPIHLDSAAITPDIFLFNFESVDVGPGEYVVFGITFFSEEPGDFIGTLTVYSSDAGFDGAQFIPVSARIIENGLPIGVPTYSPNFILHPAHPNPFNSATTITYDVARPGFVRLGIYNEIGTQVESLPSGWRHAGRYRAILSGQSLPAGGYFAVIDDGAGDRIIGKITLLK